MQSNLKKQKWRNLFANEGITPNLIRLNMLQDCAKKEWCRDPDLHWGRRDFHLTSAMRHPNYF